MKTTLELPDDLLRAIKVRAAQEGRSMKDLLTELLRTALSGRKTAVASGNRKKLPVIPSKPAKPGEEMTPERVAQILYGSGE